ncbi:DUF4376 domain-containing protein [Escherichia coli]|uniref:DUF4376 domain-containing protein n=1 Tax=Escherichia coli TaxID=562 RepID=UPI0006ACD677
MAQLCSDTDNDSEELAATPKAVKTVTDETKTKAPLDSPAFTVTSELIAVGKDARKREIEVWSTEQEAQPFTFEWNGRTWNAGPDSMARLYPAVMASKSDTARKTMVWGDAENQQVKLSMPEPEELAAAMAQAVVERNDEIYRRQREKKEALDTLEDLDAIRAFNVE